MAQSPDVRLVRESKFRPLLDQHLPAAAEAARIVTDAELRRQLPALADELGIGGALTPEDEAAITAAADRAEAAAASLEGLKAAVDETVAQSPADSAVAATVGQSGTLARAAVGDVVGLWSPSRALAKGQRVIAPNGATVVATEAHTTGPAYDDSLYLAPGAVGLTMTTYATKTDALKRVVYQESRDVMYAVDQVVAGTVYKSTSSGQTWTRMGATGFRIHTMTKVMGTGTLVAVELTDRSKAGQNPRVARSTDDGATWAQVTTLTHPGLGNQGILSPANGTVLIAEYGNTGNTVFNVRRSADDGATWTVVLSSPGTDGVNDPGHIHSIVRAPDGNILAFMDRDAPEVYKSSDLGVTWKKIGTATKQHHPNWVAPMFFTDHIAWGNDNQADGRVFRLTYSDFYAGKWDNPEVVAQLSNDRFYDTFPILPGVWVMVGATEIVDLNRPGTWAQEVYIVSDEGRSITGGLSHSAPTVRLDRAALQRPQLPGYPAVPPDMGGRSFVMLSTTDMPRPYTAVPYTVGRGLPMPHIQNGAYADFKMPDSTAIMWPSDSGTDVIKVLNKDSLGRVNLRNQEYGTDGSGIRLFKDTSSGGGLMLGETIVAQWNSTGFRFKAPALVETDAALTWITPTGASVKALTRNADNRVVLRNYNPATGTGPELRMFDNTTDGALFMAGSTVAGGWTQDGIQTNGKPLNLGTRTAGPQIITGTGAPASDLTARDGSIYVDERGSGVWVWINSEKWQPLVRAPRALIIENFRSAGSVPNTRGKYVGAQAWDATSGRPIWATGSAPTDKWVYADGSLAAQPA